MGLHGLFVMLLLVARPAPLSSSTVAGEAGSTADSVPAGSVTSGSAGQSQTVPLASMLSSLMSSINEDLPLLWPNSSSLIQTQASEGTVGSTDVDSGAGWLQAALAEAQSWPGQVSATEFLLNCAPIHASQLVAIVCCSL